MTLRAGYAELPPRERHAKLVAVSHRLIGVCHHEGIAASDAAFVFASALGLLFDARAAGARRRMPAYLKRVAVVVRGLALGEGGALF